MVDRQRLERLFLDNLPSIERAIGVICRRRGVTGDDQEDFESWAKLKLVENEYDILAKFRGESSIGTYLAVVIAMLFRDYRAQRWGRWRPSAAARRHGDLAVRLEALVYRQGYPFRQAAQLLRTSSGVTLSDREVADLLARLPARAPLRPVQVSPEVLDVHPADDASEDPVSTTVASEQRQAMEEAMARGVERLAPEDRLIVRMRFWENLTIADIARALATPQKPLYRRLDRLLAVLRRELEAEGLDATQAQELLDEVSA